MYPGLWYSFGLAWVIWPVLVSRSDLGQFSLNYPCPENWFSLVSGLVDELSITHGFETFTVPFICNVLCMFSCYLAAHLLHLVLCIEYSVLFIMGCMLKVEVLLCCVFCVFV